MDDGTKALLTQRRDRITELEDDLEGARRALEVACAFAHDESGVTQAAIGDTLGLSFQRASQLVQAGRELRRHHTIPDPTPQEG